MARALRNWFAAGIEVTVGVIEEECKWAEPAFFLHVYKKHRPYIILKWAQTSDGFFAPADQRQFLDNRP